MFFDKGHYCFQHFLALDAQIEALRKKDTADGFVTVANEIKQLARQTKSPTDYVSVKVERIGAVVTEVISGHDDLVLAVDSMQEMPISIDSAVEEQSASSLLIADYIEQASDPTQEISLRANMIGAQAQNLHKDALELEQFSSLLMNSAVQIDQRSCNFVNNIQYV
jgi:methyl-accepting chemotaxis protein